MVDGQRPLSAKRTKPSRNAQDHIQIYIQEMGRVKSVCKDSDGNSGTYSNGCDDCRYAMFCAA